MAASAAIGGFGIQLLRNGVQIAELTKIEPPAITRETFEKTHHQSPGRVKEFGKALVEMGDIGIEGNYIATGSTVNVATGLLGDFSNHTSNDTYAVVFPDSGATTWSGPAILTNFKPMSDIKDGMKFSASIKCAGQWTIA
jgi:hypothetical protein